MSFLVGILTFILVLNCLLLILLVLIQLPKKDAGAGLAFGGGAADALFGAGSGNALTKITKYAIGLFLGLALVLGYLQDKVYSSKGSIDPQFAKDVQQKLLQATPITAPAPTVPPANKLLTTTPGLPAAAPAGTNIPVGGK